MRRSRRQASLFLGLLGSALLGACGSGPSGPDDVRATPTPPPGVAITATGEGNLVVHPSADARFGFALETPLRIRETAGGSADWNFARISYFLEGREVERYELGSDRIRADGHSRIAANSNQLVRVVFRGNSDEFDRVDILLGFADLKDGRQFTLPVPFGSFQDVTLSFEPLSRPADGTIQVGP